MQTFQSVLILAMAALGTATSLADVCTQSYVASSIPGPDFLLGVTPDPDSVTVNAVYNHSVTSSDLWPGKSGLDFCNVTFAYTRDGEDSTTNLWYWLPSPSQFQNRYLSTGGGGLAITSGQAGLGSGLVYGAVTGTTDGGFGGWNAQLSDVLLLANGTMNYDQLFNFGYRAIHEMTVLGKEFTRQFYGSDEFFSYYQGCSEGGREGWSQVQRYGSQFDGAAIGAPAFRFSFQQIFHLFSYAVEVTDDYAPPSCELDQINNDTIAACDGLDGLEDGVVARSDLCLLNHNADSSVGEKYACSASPGQFGSPPSPAVNGTVTSKAAQVANDIWKGPFDSQGRRIYISFQPAASFVDASTQYDNATDTYEAVPTDFGVEFLNLFLREIESSVAPSNITYDDLRAWMLQGWQKFSDTLETTWPDLSEFHSAGGKVIHFHGESDNSIPTASSTIYHNSVRKIMYPDLDLLDGYDALHDWYRLFLVPGAGHCSRNSEQPNGPFPQNVLESLIEWVEDGSNPVMLNATAPQNAPGGADQKICSFPLRPVWKDQTMDCVFDQDSYDTWVPELNSFPMPVY